MKLRTKIEVEVDADGDEDLERRILDIAQEEAMRYSAAVADRLEAEDRKSTRLNSSHANISYAVFCLKKKKK